MSDTIPPLHPPEGCSFFERVVHRIRLEYFRHGVTFSVWGVSPGEKLVGNAAILVVTSLLAWLMLFYIPSVLYRCARQLFSNLVGANWSNGLFAAEHLSNVPTPTTSVGPLSTSELTCPTKLAS